jgi:FkbM family methyltransferase
MPDTSLLASLLRGSVNALPVVIRRLIKHLPGIAALQRWIVGRFLSGHAFVHTVNAGPARGLRFEVTLPLDKGVWSGTYEIEFSQALSRCVRPGDVCYDIGGYRGYMAGVFALAGASRVIVFEPLPENVAALERLIELNPELPINVAKLAVDESQGIIPFSVMADPSMGKLGDSPFQKEVGILRQIEVESACLDYLVASGRFPGPDVIKIDVEGAELGVLRGAEATLRKHHPAVLIEAHSAALSKGCESLLGDLGYSILQMERSAGDDKTPRHLICTHPAKL